MQVEDGKWFKVAQICNMIAALGLFLTPLFGGARGEDDALCRKHLSASFCFSGSWNMVENTAGSAADFL